MILNLSPRSSGENTTASVNGDVLTVNGVPYDLADVPDGGMATPEGEHPFLGQIRRIDGQIHATIVWEYGPGAASNQPNDSSHWIVTVTDGPVPSPVVEDAA